MRRARDEDIIEPEHRLPALLRLARPKQWLKNVLVIAAPGAAGVLTEAMPAFRTAIAFVCFCLAASGTYFLNDAIDVEADRLHPTKRTRPVAAGEVAVNTAIAGGIGLAAAALLLSFAARWQLVLVIGGYLALTFAYSVWLKHEPVLDLAAVACGFVLRAIAGGIAVGVSISPWFLIVAGAGSLFMVTGKRSAELRALGSDAGTRRSLDGYTESFLGYVRAVASSVAILAYCLWAFEKSALVGTPAWFQLSIIPFALGILRYALLLDQDDGDGAPEELVLSDRVLLAIGAVWVLLFAVAVHGG
jgi:decaprenyl-phosphate phosphoribosyltransferase